MHLANYLMGYECIKPENKEDLTSILTYHVLVGKIVCRPIMSMKTTVNGEVTVHLKEERSLLMTRK
jgi:uncharacterized surface protein with fasciclin (FAS1) repeats